MTEDDAHGWLAAHPRTSGRLALLRRYVDLLIAENGRQNLIAPSTVDQVWNRHIVDSAQLWDHAPFDCGPSLDIGSGGGLPGIVLAIMGAPITLAEPRRLRSDFLERCVSELGLDAEVVRSKGLQAPGAFTIGVARAVASIDLLIASRSEIKTWVLPRGERVEEEVACLGSYHEWTFHVKQSVTSAQSGIIVAQMAKRSRR